MTISSSEKFGLYYTSEIIGVGNGEEIALLGDLSKWVPMSSQAWKPIDLFKKSETDKAKVNFELVLSENQFWVQD